MTKNTARINEGIRALAHQPYEIISGTVVAGSTDTAAYTMSVQPTNGSSPVENVMLNAIAGDGNGLVLFPKDGSNVIIGSIDGPGEWTLIRASDITQGIITIENVSYTIDSTQVNIKNGDVVFNISSGVFKMNTASETLFQFLKDLVTYLTELTVPTPAGTSSVPVNVTDFSNLLTRLNNLLTS